MEKYAILLGYYEKQMPYLKKLVNEVENIDLRNYDKRYVFALKTQQFYTATEDLLKQIAKAFENHVEDLSSYHRELLVRLHTKIPGIRPAVLSDQSFLFLEKLRAFRHFIRHAYNCELMEKDLKLIQERFKESDTLFQDLKAFSQYVSQLA